METLGQVMRRARRAEEMSQSDIAQAWGAAAQYVSLVERGNINFPVWRIPHLPEPVRRAVIEARLAELDDESGKLKEMLNDCRTAAAE